MVETTAKMETETTIEMKEMMEMMETMDSDTSVSSTPDEPRRKRKAVTFAAVDDLCQTFTYDGVGAEDGSWVGSGADHAGLQ